MSSDLPDFYPGGADLVSRPEWAAVQAVDKDLAGSVSADAQTDTTVIYYVPSVGKTLYITHFGFALVAAAAQIYAYIYSGGVVKALKAGYGGGGMSLPKPIRVPGGISVALIVYHFSSGTKTVLAAMSGYEL